MVKKTMKIHNIEKESVRKLAQAVARPGTTYLTGYVNGPAKHYLEVDDAISDGREFIVGSRNDLEVFDLDSKYFSNTTDIEIINKLLLEQNIKFVLVNSGTGYHLFVNLWSIPVQKGDIRKPNCLEEARNWIIEFAKQFPISNYNIKELYRGERFTRTPLSPHRDKLPVSLIYPATVEEAENNLRYHGLMGKGVKNISPLAFAMIRGKQKYATQGRSITNQGLALSLVDHGYTYEDFKWIVLNSKNPIQFKNIQRAKERKRTESQINEELERSWNKAIDYYFERPPTSVTRQQILNWYLKALQDISKSSLHFRTKIRLYCLITEISLRAFNANRLEFVTSISRLHLDSQVGERSISKYNQIVTQVCDLTIYQETNVKRLNMATTTYRLDSPKQDASLTSPKLNAPLKPNYSYINNGDDSEANRNLSQLCNTNLYIDLEHLLEIWHPHDAWFATKISGGILGKLIWNLSQCLTKGTIEELCQLLEPTGNYVYKKLIPKMMQANLLEMKENKLKWIGDGQILESIAQAGDVQGKQNKRIKNIKKRQEDRAKAFEEYEKWRQEQLKQATKDTLETKFGTLEAQKLDLRRIQNFDNLEGF